MNVIDTAVNGVLVIQPRVFTDNRGCFLETWNRRLYAEAGLDVDFVQDNISVSQKGVLRGLHFQHPGGQGKLVQVLHGEVFDVAVDIRVGSPTFGTAVTCTLSDKNHRQFYIPEGFAHGFCVTSEIAVFSYKCTDYYNPATEGGILWNDPELHIHWPIAQPVLSEKDQTLPKLKDLATSRLPMYEG
jgi:dTDP-4-dehydrorhamnose 3,5-epimerase